MDDLLTTFIVVEQEFVVAEDIAETIRQAVPQADVRLVSESDAISGGSMFTSALGAGAIALAFVSMNPERCRDTGVAQAIEAVGGKLVLLVDDHEDQRLATSLGWAAIIRPFLSDQIVSFVRGGGRP